LLRDYALTPPSNLEKIRRQIAQKVEKDDTWINLVSVSGSNTNSERLGSLKKAEVLALLDYAIAMSEGDGELFKHMVRAASTEIKGT
jgi:hypothetical protein